MSEYVEREDLDLADRGSPGIRRWLAYLDRNADGGAA